MKTHIHNPNCDGDNCKYLDGQIRVLPENTVSSSNLLLCYHCYLHEMRFRFERNKELSFDCRFDIPSWQSLKIYDNK